MAQKKFAVTGVTGHAGSSTGERLLERGHAARALAHREDNRPNRLEKMGAEVVIRDFLKFNDVRAAMRGVRGAREDAKSHLCDHWLAERLFDWSGLTVAHLRDFRKTLESQTPLRQIGQTEDIAPAAVFFASSDSIWITGESSLGIYRK
jgi:NAD(P)-dependent dehydrogenase (short-subunit alcohol dehydrogenase family)